MQITSILLLAACLQVSAKTYGQQVSISGKNIPLKQVFSEIRTQTGYNFIYANEDLAKASKVTLHVKNASLMKVLESCFANQPLTYKVDQKMIIVKPKPILVEQELMPNEEITGIVIDSATGNPLVGVTIKVKGSTIGTTTGANGKFILDVPEDGLLIISYLGYKSRVIALNGKTKFSISLSSNQTELDQLVVVGFGKQKRKDVIGAVKTINPEELQARTSQLSNTFIGKIAGIIGVQRSGEPGHNSTDFWIRGVSTFGANTSPLIVIDGVEATQEDLNALPPEAINDFSVLEDASSTALYGARGANGVIIVTTKTGEIGAPKISVRLQTSVSSPTQTPKLADGVTFMKNRREALLTRAIDPSQVQFRYDDEKILRTKLGMNPYVYPDVDWLDEIFKERAINQNLNLNVSGGGKGITYFLNASIRHDQGLYRKFKNKDLTISEDNFRYTFQNNITADITHSTKIGVKINAILNSYTRPDANTGTLYAQALTVPPVEFPPFFPSEKGKDYIQFGNNNGGPLGNGLFTNPFATYSQGIRIFNESTVKAIFNINQDLSSLTKGLEVRGLASFRNFSIKQNYRFYNPNFFRVGSDSLVGDHIEYTTIPATPLNSNLLNYSHPTSGNSLVNFHVVLSYKRSFNVKHNVSATAVYLQRNLVNTFENLPHRNQGVSGRLTYNYDSRYFTEADLGYTGSANFGKGHRFGLFPSFSVGYLISNEEYFKPLTKVISNLKLRASYGMVGNEQTPQRFPYLTTVELNNRNSIFGNDFNNDLSGPLITKYGTPLSSWEKSKKLNLGIDLGLLNHIKLSADYFHEIRTGIFMRRRIIPYAFGIGGARPFANIGEVENEGFDMSLTADYSTTDFSISFKGTFTYAHNEVRARDVPASVPDYLSPIGKPINSFTVLHSEGLLRPKDLKDGIQRNGYSGVMEGDIKYVDLNGDGTINDQDRYQTKASSLPEIVYGFGPSIRFKKFDFSFFFQGIAKVQLAMSDIYPFGQTQRSILKFVADDHWTEANQNYQALYPRLSGNLNLNDILSSDYWLRNGAFLRLKRAEIGYSIKQFRIYLSGMNLLTFSPFRHWDPELGSGNGLAYPPVRIFSLGVHLSL